MGRIKMEGGSSSDEDRQNYSVKYMTAKNLSSAASKYIFAPQPGDNLLYNRPTQNPTPGQFNEAVYPHVASFNTLIDHYIPEIVKELDPIYVDPHADRFVHELNPYYAPTECKYLVKSRNPVHGSFADLKIFVRKISLGKPARPDAEGIADLRLWPRACRNGHLTYSAPLYIEFVFSNTAQKSTYSLTKHCGDIPIMLRSKACHLNGLSLEEIVAAGEEPSEFGGYFIINGNERCIRYVVQQRCNHPIALKKPRFRERDLFFTEFAVLMRCARSDGTSTANILFMTEDNQCAFRALVNRQEVVCPFWTLLRALAPRLSLDLLRRKVFEGSLDGRNNDAALRYMELNMLWKDFVEQESVFTDVDQYEHRHLHQLGKIYWDLVGNRLRPGARYEDAGRHVINRYILVHCKNWTAKFEALLLMYRKLIELSRGRIRAENIDSFAYQEVISPGQLIAGILKDSIWSTLQRVKMAYVAEMRAVQLAGDDPVKIVRSRDHFELILKRLTHEISHSLAYFMATGNIKTMQLDLQQLSGWTVVADRLNLNRFLSHFRAVHRGQFFAQMRTTEVRKLLGETWGFLCPVHTPDGGPCGLLLHLAQHAVPVTDAPDGMVKAAFKVYLKKRNIPVDLTGDILVPPSTDPDTFPLVFDGEPLCRLPRREMDYWEAELRRLKQTCAEGISPHLEVAVFRRGVGAYDGIFIFSGPGRLVRPVHHLETGNVEWIGPLGQPWMNIACMEQAEEDKIMLQKQRQVIKDSIAPKDVEIPVKVENEDPMSNAAVAEKAAETVTATRAPGPKISSMKDVIAAYTQHCQDQLLRKKKKEDIINKKGAFESIIDQGKHNQTVPVDFSHAEISPTTLLSITSALTPFSNHNQSPRNMYQCQMLKQTMGTPFLAVPFRTDNKAYRLLTPQIPCVRTQEFREYKFDEYPTGTNAIVAVISYTGYDMEDAMILNKSSMERGFCHACVYKTKIIEAAPASARGFEARNHVFSNRTPSGKLIEPKLGPDGLPPIGACIDRDTPLYRTCTLDGLASEATCHEQGHTAVYHDDERAYVDKINFIAPPETSRWGAARARGSLCQKVSLKLRCVRNPLVGDKFASRAGQKGILSMMYPQEDMPFTESGIVPDIVFNPHGFPSRMTVGMLIESMAGKSAALHGKFQDCTPFRSFPRQKTTGNRWIDQGGYDGFIRRGGRYMTPDEEKKAREKNTDSSVDYFGKELLQAGFSYYGSEPLYSGIHGEQMQADIFIGVIYYQRLRHMVSDKWQVRSTGPVDALTRQPVKGRKRGGGVRFGEMERDALLAHGTSALLQDRLLHCSDEHRAFVCPSCGSILSATLQPRTGPKKPVAVCRICDVPCRLIALPYVFRYICNELIAMNVTIKLQLSERDKPLVVKPRSSFKLITADKTNAVKNEEELENDEV